MMSEREFGTADNLTEVAHAAREIAAALGDGDREASAEPTFAAARERAGGVFAAAGYGEERPVALIGRLLVVRLGDGEMGPQADAWSWASLHGRRVPGRWPQPPDGSDSYIFAPDNSLVFARMALAAVRQRARGGKAELRQCEGMAAGSGPKQSDVPRRCRLRQRAPLCGAHAMLARYLAVEAARQQPGLGAVTLNARPTCEYCWRARAEALLLDEYEDTAICWTCRIPSARADARRLEIRDDEPRRSPTRT